MKELKPKRKGNYRHTGNPIHGLFKGNEGLFNLWQTIKTRCQNKNRASYKDYGGRGINLCKEWETASNFVKWALDNGYKKGLQIARINNNLGYYPENCRFVTCKENLNNRRNSVRFNVEGEQLTAEEVSKKYGVSVYSIYYWRRKFGAEQAVLKAMDAWNKKSKNYDNIKPCKDCGCPKVLPYMKEREGWWDMVYAMCCDRCGKKTKFYKTLEEAQDAWNERNK